MPIIIRTQDNPYAWAVGETDLDKVANIEKTLPSDFISDESGFSVTKDCIQYLQPLINGEDYPPYVDGAQLCFSEETIRAKKTDRLTLLLNDLQVESAPGNRTNISDSVYLYN